jgi:hypothetical protein
MKKSLFVLSAALVMVGCSRDADTDTTTVSDNSSRNRNYGTTNSIINEPAGSSMNPDSASWRASNTNLNSGSSTNNPSLQNGRQQPY